MKKIYTDPGRGVFPSQQCKKCQQLWTANYIKDEVCTCCFQSYRPEHYSYLRHLETLEISQAIKDLNKRTKLALKPESKKKRKELLIEMAQEALTRLGWSKEDIDKVIKP